MQAVILAGGLGTRLGAITDCVPKPMVTVAGKPYLEHQLSLLSESGIRNVVLLTGYLGEQIEHYFEDGRRFDLRIRYSREPQPMGTGGALKLAAPLLENTFLLIYGDSYLPIDYTHVLDALEFSDAEGLMVVFDNRDCSSPVKGNVELHSNGRVRRYEKDSPDYLTFVEAGVLAFRRSLVTEIPDGVVSIESEIYPKLIARNSMLGYPTEQCFFDIGTPERLARIDSFLSSSNRQLPKTTDRSVARSSWGTL